MLVVIIKSTFRLPGFCFVFVLFLFCNLAPEALSLPLKYYYVELAVSLCKTLVVATMNYWRSSCPHAYGCINTAPPPWSVMVKHEPHITHALILTDLQTEASQGSDDDDPWKLWSFDCEFALSFDNVLTTKVLMSSRKEAKRLSCISECDCISSEDILP